MAPVSYAALDPAPAALAARTTSDVGAVIDLGPRRSVRLLVAVTAVAGTSPQLALALETSPDQAAWRTLGTLAAIAAAGPVRAVLPGADRYARLRWTITGTGPSFTFGVTGEAYRSYATPAELATHGLPAPWLDKVDLATQDEHLVAFSDTIDRYLKKQVDLPLAAPFPPWLANLCARGARWGLMTRKGFNPEGDRDPIRLGYEDAMRELRDIASGAAELVDLVDATPTTDEGGPVLVSDTPRRMR